MSYTVVQAQAFFDAAAAAYLKAVKAKEYAHSGSQVTFSKENQDVDKLRFEMDYWQQELALLSDGGGILEGRAIPGYEQ